MLNRLSTIPLSDVRERTKMQLRLQNTSEHDDFIEVLIHEGLRHINSLYQLDKMCCTLDIEDNKAKLPSGFVKLLGIVFAGSDGNCYQYLYADRKFLTSCGTTCDDSWWDFNDTFQINNGYVYFRSDNQATTCRIAYMGLNTDSFGNMVIYEDFERALTSYACHKFTLAYFDMFPAAISAAYKNEWVSQKAWLKGSAQKEDFELNKREIQNIFKSLTVSNLLNL